MTDARTPRSHWHLGVAIDGHGLHPGSWRTVAAPDPTGLLDGSVMLRHTLRAEASGLDFVTLDDSLSLTSGGVSCVRGRVDALLAMAKLGPLTSMIGLIPTITTTHTEPFHVSKNVATLDWVSQGRGGWRVAVSTTQDEAAHFGRTEPRAAAALHAEAADVVEVVRRLWDSWEDDAIIRDRPTGRFIDRDKVHYIDFEGEWFSVRGPSIVPRSPQGQPLVAVEAIDDLTRTLAAVAADIVFVDALDPDDAARQRAAILDAVTAVGRNADDVSVIANVDIVVSPTTTDAEQRLAALDRFATWDRPASRSLLVSSAANLVGTFTQWAAVVDGLHVRPAVHDDDLATLLADVVPSLRDDGLVRPAAPGSTLRNRFALPRPTSRYAATASPTASPTATSHGVR